MMELKKIIVISITVMAIGLAHGVINPDVPIGTKDYVLLWWVALILIKDYPRL
jgi:hypothetical protein